MVRCIITSCTSDSGRKDANISFHRFPSDLALFTSWVTAIGRPNWDPTKGSRLCSKHFEAHCFLKTQKSNVLLPGSVPKLLLQDKSVETKAKKDDTISSICTNNDSPRARELKQQICLLRKKSRADGIKIKCLQGKIRRILRKQGKLIEKDEAPAKSHRGLKRRRSSASPDQSGSTESLPPSPNASIIDKVHFDAEEEMDTIKYELMDESVEAGPLACTDTTTGEEDMIEEIKIEQDESDPLMLGVSNASIEDLTIEDEETLTTTEKCCDEDYFPGTDDNLPQIDALVVAEYFAAFPNYVKDRIRGIWRQPREHLNDSIGYVQIKKENVIRTIKCVIATRTSANNCTIIYNVARKRIKELLCDCDKSPCHHGISALTWLCNREAGPGTYWIQPMITRDPKSLRISEIFGFKKSQNTLEMEQNQNTVMEDFIDACQKKNILKPLVTYSQQNLKEQISLPNLMSKFKLKCNKMDAKRFLDFCHENINKGKVVKIDETTVEERRELFFGRVTDGLLYNVCRQNEVDAEGLVDKIIFPDVQDEVEVNADVIESIEKSLKMKINRCSLLLLPIFAASPYGTTETHVIHIDQSSESNISAENKITQQQNACLQLQMYLARKEKACLCVLRENRVDVIMVKLNKVRVKEMLKKAKLFWQNRIFKHLMDD